MLSRVPELRTDIEKKLPLLLREGYVNYDGNILSLTPKGFLVSNQIIGHLVF